MIINTVEAKVTTPTTIALGNFDGIHRGHQAVLQPVLNCQNNDLCKSVVSFDPHPREFFSGQKMTLLTPQAEKANYLQQLGFQQLILIPFNQDLAKLSPQDFIQEILLAKIKAKIISVGEDFHFGYQRKGNAKQLQEITSKFKIKTYINSLLQYENNNETSVRVSSSLIRKALSQGNIKQANLMLGRAYILEGKVVEGKKLGRTIGFPTANLSIPEDKYLPCNGVYAVKVNYQNEILPAVMNIGLRPTVSGNSITVEVHLLEWTGDLYGKTITVSLQEFLRSEQKFPSLSDLKQQISLDCQKAKKLLTVSQT